MRKSWRSGKSHTLVPVLVALAATALMASCAANKAQLGSTTSSAPPPSTSSSTTAAAPVPTQYQDLYSGLSADLDHYQSAVDQMPTYSNSLSATAVSAELLPASGNLLTKLLQPKVMNSVDIWLNRYKSMGITGVTLAIKLPLLLSSFSSNSEQYIAFYSTVVQHAHAMGFTVDAELGALFCGTTFANCTNPFTGAYQDFVNKTIEQAKIVINQIRPDDMTIMAEPTTEASLSGVQSLDTPQGCSQYVHDVLAAIGPHPNTRVGAGAASWMPPSFDQGILTQPIDYLDMHTYPINIQYVDNMIADTALAEASRKPIVADEFGLYKTDSSKPADAATSDSVYRLDNFSFFEPLDERFFTISSQWAKKAGVTYFSYYWAGELFSYLTWTPALDALPYQQLESAALAQQGKAILSGASTDLGRSYPGLFAG